MSRLLFVELDGTIICLNNVLAVQPWSDGQSALITFVGEKREVIVRWPFHKVRDAISNAAGQQ